MNMTGLKAQLLGLAREAASHRKRVRKQIHLLAVGPTGYLAPSEVITLQLSAKSTVASDRIKGLPDVLLRACRASMCLIY